MTDESVDEELLRSLTQLAREGAGLAEDFADHAKPGSHSALITFGTPATGNPWTPEDVRFLLEALRALVLVAGSQLSGVGELLAAGLPVRLHPLATLVRGIAEACGKIWWLAQPLLATLDQDAQLSPLLWGERAVQILHRSQLARLDTLYERRRRRKASPGQENDAIREIQE